MQSFVSGLTRSDPITGSIRGPSSSWNSKRFNVVYFLLQIFNQFFSIYFGFLVLLYFSHLFSYNFFVFGFFHLSACLQCWVHAYVVSEMARRSASPLWQSRSRSDLIFRTLASDFISSSVKFLC